MKVEGLLLQRVHRVEDSNNHRLFEILSQGVRAEFLLGTWVCKWNLRRDSTFEVFKGRRNSKESHKRQVQEGEHWFISQKSLRSESGGQNSPRRTREITWTIESRRSVRRLRLSDFQNSEISGGVTTIGWEASGVVDLALKIFYFEFRSLEWQVLLESLHRKLPVCEIVPTIRSMEAHIRWSSLKWNIGISVFLGSTYWESWRQGVGT